MTELQLASLEEGKQAESWKLYGDLITANIYALKKGMEKASLVNYFDEAMPTVEVKLDSRYTPAQNAQSYYKKYNKAKSARVMLTAQIEESKAESAYIDTVFESLAKAETENDLAEIRAELALSGYGKKLDNMRRAHGLGKDRAQAKERAKAHALCHKRRIYRLLRQKQPAKRLCHHQACRKKRLLVPCQKRRPDRTL